MPTLIKTTEIDASIERVWAFHASLDGLKAVTPPSTKLRIPDPPARLGEGVRFTLIVAQPPFFVPVRWETVFVAWEPPHRFVDEQGRFGPFARWRHEHRFEAIDSQTTRLTDHVDYAAPLGLLGRIAERLFLNRMLDRIFDQRQAALKRVLGRSGSAGSRNGRA